MQLTLQGETEKKSTMMLFQSIPMGFPSHPHGKASGSIPKNHILDPKICMLCIDKKDPGTLFIIIRICLRILCPNPLLTTAVLSSGWLLPSRVCQHCMRTGAYCGWPCELKGDVVLGPSLFFMCECRPVLV